MAGQTRFWFHQSVQLSPAGVALKVGNMHCSMGLTFDSHADCSAAWQQVQSRALVTWFRWAVYGCCCRQHTIMPCSQCIARSGIWVISLHRARPIVVELTFWVGCKA
jgi:hypothetical protein